MARLVEDLLDVGRLSHGHVSIRKDRVDLAALVGRTVEDYRGFLAAAEVALEVELPDGEVTVDADTTRLAARHSTGVA